jgi:hypothetical protein
VSQSAENDRPDRPRVGLFNRHPDAVAEASFRAAITRMRYRVFYDPRNRWWNVTESTSPIPPEVGGESRG